MARLRQYSEAIDLCRLVVEAEPDNVEPKIWIGACLIVSGEIEKAIRHMKATTKSHPEELMAWATLGSAYSKRLRWLDAVDA